MHNIMKELDNTRYCSEYQSSDCLHRAWNFNTYIKQLLNEFE